MTNPSTHLTKLTNIAPQIVHESTTNPYKFNGNRSWKKVDSMTRKLFSFVHWKCGMGFWAQLDPEGDPEIIIWGITLER